MMLSRRLDRRVVRLLASRIAPSTRTRPAGRGAATNASNPADAGATDDAPSSADIPEPEPRYTNFFGPRIDLPFFIGVGLASYFLFHDRARGARGEDTFFEKLSRQRDRWARRGLEIRLPYIGVVRVIKGTDATVAAAAPPEVVAAAVEEQPAPKPKVTVADVEVDPKEIESILKAMSDAIQDPQQTNRR